MTDQLEKLRRAAIESKARWETFENLGRKKLIALKNTEKALDELEMYHDVMKEEYEALGESEDDESEDDENPKEDLRKGIQVFERQWERTNNQLDQHQKDFNEIRFKLDLSKELAKQHNHLFSEAKREYEQNRLQFPQEELDWLPNRTPDTKVIQPKDDVAIKLFKELSPENQEMFEELRQILFNKAFAQQVNLFKVENRIPDYIKNDQLPKKPEILLIGEIEKMESLIASRMAMWAFENGTVPDYKLDIDELREEALEQLEQEEKAAIKAAEIEMEMRDAEKERRKTAVKSKGRRRLIPYLSNTMNCEPLLNFFYKDLKQKHLKQTDCKNFVKKFVEKAAKQKDPKNLEKILTIQLNRILDDESS